MNTHKVNANEKTESACSWRVAVAMGFKDSPQDDGGMADYFMSHYEVALLELSEARDRIIKLESSLLYAEKRIKKAKKALRRS